MSDKQKSGEIETTAYPDLRHPQPLSFADVRRNTQLVKQALREIMVKDVDYGTTPGCGDKPGLKKPGAEKLGFLFKIGCFPQTEDKSENGEFTYIIRTKAVHQPTGIDLGEGVGAASTLEEKYAWRAAVCKEEWEATPDERKRLKWQKKWKEGRPTGEHESIMQVRDNPANKQNTVLKMAAKRSMVDVIVKVTAASDIFNQGEDDIIIDIDEPRQPEKPKAKKAEPTAHPDSSQAPQPAGYIIMAAKRDGICKGCQKAITIGNEIAFSKEKGAYHRDCVT